eukprot:8336214-Pyramimonas_sp.AAC.1
MLGPAVFGSACVGQCSVSCSCTLAAPIGARREGAHPLIARGSRQLRARQIHGRLISARWPWLTSASTTNGVLWTGYGTSSSVCRRRRPSSS